ncbi:hypothetical protein [Salinicola peritrichatus]|uniref:hypothetical protein n=1 Tax=Salinicola peritrichatus TaxID=1267424 RepID=UPI0013A62E93|nr:hypothetical protein [Salinicola peritrichatus]
MAVYEEDTPRPRMLNLLIGVTLATIVVALWYLLDYYLRESTHDVTWYPPQQGCVLLEGGCRAGLGLSSALAFSLQEAAGRSGLTFEARVSGLEAERVYVEFVGRDMNVHSRRFVLQPVENGLFVGHGDLGFCSAHVHAWRAQVTVVSNHGLKGSWFDFDSARLTDAVTRRDARREAMSGCLWTETTETKTPT